MRRVAADREARGDPMQGPETSGRRPEIRKGGRRGRLPRGHEGLEGRLGWRLAKVAHHGIQLGENGEY